MSLPDIAVINFSSLEDRTVQKAIRGVNRQVTEDFQPIWGAGYLCKLHASPFVKAPPATMQEDPIQAEAVIYLVDEPNVAGALGYHDLNNSEVPVGFVFTDLGDWTVTFSHEVLELIIDPTVNILVPGPDPREPNNPNAWLFHTYEVCDAVERAEYEIDGVVVSNFVTPSYFSEGNAPGTRNDFLGVGVDSFGVIPGSHLGTIDPSDFSWVEILGSEYPSRNTIKGRMDQFVTKKGPRLSASKKQEAHLEIYQSSPVAGGKGMPAVTSFTRSGRKKIYAEKCRLALGKR